jgi:hypothetical protein
VTLDGKVKVNFGNGHWKKTKSTKSHWKVNFGNGHLGIPIERQRANCGAENRNCEIPIEMTQ